MSNVTIFIDESGTLPDSKDRVIIVAVVGVSSLQRLETIIKSIRKRGKFKRSTGEIKFYSAGDKTKKLFFEKIAKDKFDVFILIVEKMGRVIADTPENFAVLSGLLLVDVFAFYPKVSEIIFDRHFHKEKEIKVFNEVLANFLERTLPKISHVDSKQNKNVNVADMVAGAVLAKESGKDKHFYEMFKDLIISELRLNWPEAKRKLFRR